MAPRYSGNGETTKGSWPELAAQWLLHQGVSTVLLLALAYAAYQFIPSHMKDIQAGYERFEAAHHQSQKDMLDRWSAERVRDREYAALEREKDRAEWSRIVNRHLAGEGKANGKD